MTKFKEIVKRNGKTVAFEADKIVNAIAKAFKATGEISAAEIDSVPAAIESLVESKLSSEAIPTVEQIQDMVETTLMGCGYSKTAKAYILYRSQHGKMRAAKETMLDYKKLVDGYIGSTKDWRVKENSTVTQNLGGFILSNSGAITANYWLSEIYDDEISEAHRKCFMHIHDLSMLSGYCAGWSLKQLIQEGLGGVAGRITSAPAKHLSTLCNQMVNFLGIMQNEWAGAQAFSSFDTYLAPFVKRDNLSYKEVKQAVQSFVYGVNTPSRWGCVPEDTEILTVEGFKKYTELKKGELIYTWKDGALRTCPLNEVVVKQFNGKLHSYKAQGYEQSVTPEHRILATTYDRSGYRIAHSKDIFDVKTPKPLVAAFEVSEIPDCELSDEEIMLAAAVYTDGSIDMRGESVHKVSIYKSEKREGNCLIQRTSEKLGLKYSLTKVNGEFGSLNKYTYYSDSARKILALVGSKKKIHPRFLKLGKRQAELFLKTWATFDGDEEKMRCQYDNQDIADALQHIAILAGQISYIYENGKASYVKVRRGKTAIPHAREEIEYNGVVWCPNSEDGTAVYRRGGNVFISGNCQAPFTNITLDWTVPNDMEYLPALVGGKEMPFTYGDCKKEMDMINKAFIEIMIEGDANGRGFQYPIPTYSITKDFDWSETENNKMLFEMAAKYGTPYFSNYVNSDMEPSDIRSMCCRLRLDLRELRKRGGGFFGSGESTGSVGVVTLNLPRIAYLSKSKEDFYNILDKYMDIAARSLHMKRTVITRLMDEGMYPYTKQYLGSFGNHFSTIGIIGMNEALLNASWMRESITTEKGHKFAIECLEHMRSKLSDYQEMYEDELFNLEATPAESTTYRFAKHDVEDFPDIITAAKNGMAPFYTNSTHLPVGYTDDIFEALEMEDELQTMYTSGTVFHGFLGERLPSWKAAAGLVKKICDNFKLPYVTLSPTYSVCAEHGYLSGEVKTCPKCGRPTEVYSRITGYYRPLSNWNDGKQSEFSSRLEYKPDV